MHDEMDDGDTDEKENGRDGKDDNDNDDNVLELPTLGEDENEWDGHSIQIYMDTNENNNISTWGSC